MRNVPNLKDSFNYFFCNCQTNRGIPKKNKKLARITKNVTPKPISMKFVSVII
jgi:hypothetical protein